jgi:hypothetical protein
MKMSDYCQWIISETSLGHWEYSMITKNYELSFFSPVPIRSLTEPESPGIIANLVRIAEPLRDIHSRKDIDAYLNRVLPEYMIIKFVIVSEMTKDYKEVDVIKEIRPETNGTTFELFNRTNSELFTREDRECVLEVLKENNKIINTAAQIPSENAGALFNAIVKGSAPIQKLDIIMTVIALISLKIVSEFDSKTVHALCLQASRYLNEFRTQIFMNNPVLTKRLQEPVKTISNVEMEKLLGISG